MKTDLFRDYSRNNVHFYDDVFPAFLELGFNLMSDVEKPRIVDLGCGDGKILFALHKKGLLDGFSEIVGVDLSEERIRRMKKALPFVKGVVSDASDIKDCPSSFFDYVICSQVIEHVQDDGALVVEIKRILKPCGVAFISSVIKRWYGVYFYSSNGSFRLDPTHVREYSSADKFVSLMQEQGLEVIGVETRQIMFPILDLLLRLFVRFGLVEPDTGFFRKHKSLKKIRGFRTPITGYKYVEVLVRKIE